MAISTSAGSIASFPGAEKCPELGSQHGRSERERVLREFSSERPRRAMVDECVRLLRWRRLPLPG